MAFELRVILIGLVSLFLVSSVSAKVIIPGTGDSQMLLRILATEFQNETGIEVEVPDSIGSFGGIKSVVEGKAKLGRVARPLKGKEEQFSLNYRVFAYSPVVFAANLPENCFDDSTIRQLVNIFSGEIDNWGQVKGCPDAKIYVATRETGDSSRKVLENRIPQLKEVMGMAGKTVFTTPELIEILETYQYTIGYAPLAMVDPRKLKVLSLEGTAPTPENVRSGDYPLMIPFGIVWKDNLNGEEKSFFDYLFSEAAQQRIAELGLIPIR